MKLNHRISPSLSGEQASSSCGLIPALFAENQTFLIKTAYLVSTQEGCRSQVCGERERNLSGVQRPSVICCVVTLMGFSGIVHSPVSRLHCGPHRSNETIWSLTEWKQVALA